MVRLTTCCLVLGLVSATAHAEKKAPPPPATLPKVGDVLAEHGGADWPTTLSWMYEAPSPRDSAGKIIVYWFCAAKVEACTDDLARIVTLRETDKVYVIAYINGGNREAKKLDPIRESEGIGRGTVAFGPPVTTMMKQLGLPGPASIVVGTDGKVALVSTASDAAALDARDTKVNALIGAIKDYTTAQDGPGTPKAGEKFGLTFKIQLASWLDFTKQYPSKFTLTVPKDIKCDATTLAGDQLKVEGKTLTASVSCSAPKGSYQARGEIKFSYDSPTASSVGQDGATWTFQVK